LETVACNLCGSERHAFAYEMPDRRFFPNEFFKVVECQECGLGFVNPRPTIQEIAKYYPPEYYKSPGTESFDRYLRKRFSREARYLDGIRNGAATRTLLDVGCANGEFPRFMAVRGWQVEGVEVSPSSARITDFRVHTQEFDKIPIDLPTYDAVTAWAVLEHVHNPMAYFQKASQVLRPGGQFIFAVTNFHSVASRYLFCEDIPRHLYFFTRETVREYLQKTGLILINEVNGRAIYKLAPSNWLSYMMRARLQGKEFRYEDIPLSSREFRREKGLKPGIRASLQYLAYSPAASFDRMLWPIVETAQILRKNYGISVYVARKD
jgi:SAM-dependent methyltransferase